MLYLYDRATMAHALTLDLDPTLRPLLKAQIDRLTSGEYDLSDRTEIVVIEAGDTNDDVVNAVEFSPIVDSLDGARYLEPGFRPHWDWLVRQDGWFFMVITYGGTFAHVLLIEDDEGTMPDLLGMCRRYAGSQPWGTGLPPHGLRRPGGYPRGASGAAGGDVTPVSSSTWT